MFKAYAANNHIEYLAEISEAYFSTRRFRNDYLPIVRSQFKSYDIDGYKLVEQVFFFLNHGFQISTEQIKIHLITMFKLKLGLENDKFAKKYIYLINHLNLGLQSMIK